MIGAELKDEKGNLNRMLKILADGQINVNYIYSFVIRRESPGHGISILMILKRHRKSWSRQM